MEVAFKSAGLAQSDFPSQLFCQQSNFVSKSIAGGDNASVLQAACHNSENLAATSCWLGKKDMLCERVHDFAPL